MPGYGDRWNAIEVLQIEDRFTCVGYAPSQGRKCRKRIAAANRQYASKILCQMQSMDVTTADLRGHLEELAPRILCKLPAHQNQASTMISQWLGEVDFLREERVRRQRQAAVPAQSTSVPASVRMRPSEPEVTVISTQPRVTPRTQRFTRVGSPSVSPQQVPTPPTTPSRRQDREPSSTPASTRAPSPPPARTTTRPLSPPTPAPAPAALAAPAPAPAPPAAVAPAVAGTDERTSSPTTLQQPHDEVEVEAPIPHPPTTSSSTSTEECSICYDPISPSTGISSTCNHLFHATCINAWFDTSDATRTRSRQCPYCRSNWTRQKIEGDCCICLNSLEGESRGDNDNNRDGRRRHRRGRGEGESDAGSASESSSSSSPRLVWCQSQCGQNFHGNCMLEWLVASTTQAQAGRCPGCRAEWVS